MPATFRFQITFLANLRKLKLEEERERGDAGEWACGRWFEYALVVALAALLLLAALVLALFWALYYRQGFAWSDAPQRQFNLHPVLRATALLFRVCRCCRRLHVKLFHMVLHALAIPCVVVGFWAALDWHELQQPPLPHFHSLHSWLGLVTMGLFALQFVVGFFSFLVLLCCEGATAAFRAALVPVHAAFGITTFMLAIATCLTGLSHKAYELYGAGQGSLNEEQLIINTMSIVFSLCAIVAGYALMRDDFRHHGHILIDSDGLYDMCLYAFYPTSWSEEGIIINALAMVLVALGILVSYTVRREGSRGEGKTFLSERL
ncbi:Cytochrome b561, putative [Gryllus bimaculatus]|nr:Cytochrome b561, putative [Gryllus bimaculatus]